MDNNVKKALSQKKRGAWIGVNQEIAKYFAIPLLETNSEANLKNSK